MGELMQQKNGTETNLAQKQASLVIEEQLAWDTEDCKQLTTYVMGCWSAGRLHWLVRRKKFTAR